jgi:hypothetical protein
LPAIVYPPSPFHIYHPCSTPSCSPVFSSYFANSFAEDFAGVRQKILNSSKLTFHYWEHSGIIVTLYIPHTCTTWKYSNILWCSVSCSYLFPSPLFSPVISYSLSICFHI